MSRNRVIGADGRLPWHLPADLKRFKSLTMGHPLLMGRKTHESIGRPLPGRTNLVMTYDNDYTAAGCVVVHSIAEALSQAGQAPELLIIGGASLYAEFLPDADRIHLTLIHHDYTGDVFFPQIDVKRWQVNEREDIDADPGFPYRYSFMLLERLIASTEASSCLNADGGLK